MIGNQIKTVLFLGILSGILLVVGQLVGGVSGLTIALIFAVLMNFGSYFFSHKLILKIYKAKEASKADYPDLHEMVESLALRAEIPKPQIYIIPKEESNALACGPNPQKAVVAVTKGIMDLLDKDELKGVLAHEIGHIKNRDILISTIAATIASVITYIAFMARWGALFGGFGGDREGGNNIVGLIVMAIIAPLAATLVQLAISRSREFIADETGARLIQNSKPLASALERLESNNKHHPMKNINPATSHMFIVKPAIGSGIWKLFSTHPSTQKRVERLNSLVF